MQYVIGQEKSFVPYGGTNQRMFKEKTVANVILCNLKNAKIRNICHKDK